MNENATTCYRQTSRIGGAAARRCCCAATKHPTRAVVCYYTNVVTLLMTYRFEWDPDKAEFNLRKHGVSFEVASRAFLDPRALTVLDRVERGEQR